MLTLIKSYIPNAVRHGLQIGAGALVASGDITAIDATNGTAAVMVLLSIAWSIAEKRGLLKAIGF